MFVQKIHNGRIVEVTHHGGQIRMSWAEARELHRWLTTKLYGWQAALQMHPKAGKQQ